jgi:hypothetical protein
MIRALVGWPTPERRRSHFRASMLSLLAGTFFPQRDNTLLFDVVGLIVILAAYGMTVYSAPGASAASVTGSISSSSVSTINHASTTQTGTAKATGQFGTATGIIIPFYIPPGNKLFAGDLSAILADKNAFPNVPMIVIINPDSGVGSSRSAALAAAVILMQQEGIYVFGYDWTNYGCLGSQGSLASTCSSMNGDPNITLGDIQGNMTYYSKWYGVQGTFFDGMANTVGFESFYSGLSRFAGSLGQNYTVGNPGTEVPSSYIANVTSLVVYEGSTLPSVLCIGTAPCLAVGWHQSYSKYNFALIEFDQPQLSALYVQQAAQYVGWMYLTDNTGCTGQVPYGWCGLDVTNPYNTLPSYLRAETAALSAAQG